MASLNTNAAAITALRTLQQTNASLDKTQNKISTGYKIGEAKDNAAYWAISTTLKSDNKSLGTVKDALGLGASTVDVAYQGLNKAKDVLDEIKSKLTAATQDGLDRNTIQNEITQLQDQLKSIATSSVFSGENWLSVDTSVNGFNAEKQVVASFSRDGNGSVSIGTIKVQTAMVALFDASSAAGAGGIIDGAVNLKGKDGRDLTIGGTDVVTGNSSKAGLDAAAGTAQGTITAGATPATNVPGVTTTSGAYTPAAAFGVSYTATSFAAAAGDKVVLHLSVDSGTVNAEITATPAGGNNINALTVDDAIAQLNDSAKNSAFTAKAVASKNAAGALIITSKTTGTLSTVAVSAIATVTLTNAGTSPTLAVGGYSATVAAGTAPSVNGINETKAANKTGVAVTLASPLAVTDKITFDLLIDGVPVKVTVPRGGTAGSSDADLQTALINSLNADATFSSRAVASLDASKLVLTSKGTGAAGSVVVNSVSFSDANGLAKNVTGTGFNNVATAATASTTAFGAPIVLDKDDHIYFNIQVDSATAAKTITIDQALINKALSTPTVPVTNGTINNADDYKKVIDAALTAQGVTSVMTAKNVSNQIVFTSKTVGTASAIKITDVAASQGGDTISVKTIDISTTKLTGMTSDEIKSVLAAYIEVVNTAINKVTSAAASLGSVASRIDMQKSFVNTLMDTIDKGVGNLIDADMSEESTKLQALQVKQQLGVQALSIANQSSQNILSLFQSR